MEFFEDDNEEWSNPVNHLIAGSFAGVVEHCGMYPIDTIKTHVQATNKKYEGLFKTMNRITSKSGYRGLFRGMGAIALGSVPSHATFFGIYEVSKYYLGANMAGHHPIATAISGGVASVCLDAILTPMDAIKQRMQLGSNYYSSTLDCLKKVVRREGFRSLYAGFTTQLTMNIPYHAIFLSSYESFKKFYKNYFGINDKDYDLMCHITSSILGGMTAGALTTPLDVAKTRLQTQSEMGKLNHYKGMINTVVKIYREESILGLFRGVRERMLFNSFSAAICWTSYEFIKMVLQQ